MFVILTVVLFTYYTYRLFKPIDNEKYGLFFKRFEDNKEIGQILRDMEFVELVEFKETMTGFIIILFQQCIEFLYLIFALKYDILLYPTLVIIIWWIIVIAKPNKKTLDDVIIEFKTKTFKRKRRVIAIIDVLYFGYMFIIMVSQYL